MLKAKTFRLWKFLTSNHLKSSKCHWMDSLITFSFKTTQPMLYSDLFSNNPEKMPVLSCWNAILGQNQLATFWKVNPATKKRSFIAVSQKGVRSNPDFISSDRNSFIYDALVLVLCVNMRMKRKTRQKNLGLGNWKSRPKNGSAFLFTISVVHFFLAHGQH